MLQVLCQILQTESLVDVQSWLVSASDSEKERVKQLIDRAMAGLEESGRINTSNEATNAASFSENQLKSFDFDANKSSISEIANTLNRQ
jgi:hypothetical protein